MHKLPRGALFTCTTAVDPALQLLTRDNGTAMDWRTLEVPQVRFVGERLRRDGPKLTQRVMRIDQLRIRLPLSSSSWSDAAQVAAASMMAQALTALTGQLDCAHGWRTGQLQARTLQSDDVSVRHACMQSSYLSVVRAVVGLSRVHAFGGRAGRVDVASRGRSTGVKHLGQIVFAIGRAAYFAL